LHWIDRIVLFIQLAIGAYGVFAAIRNFSSAVPDPQHYRLVAIAILVFVSLTAMAAALALLRQRAWGHFLNLPWIIMLILILAAKVNLYPFGTAGPWTWTLPPYVERAMVIAIGLSHILGSIRKGFSPVSAAA